MSTTAIDMAARAIDRAITNKGIAPAWHDRIAAKHRAEWPTLWAAIDGLRAALAVRELEADEQRLLLAEEKGDSWEGPESDAADMSFPAAWKASEPRLDA